MEIIFNWIGGATFILTVGNINIAIDITSHIPNGGFTALCKAFRPLKLLLGLTVESPAIRH
jgi:hypothetical protein